MTDRELMQMALETMEAAIKSGDWQVDGACDPEIVLVRLRERLSKPDPVEVEREACAKICDEWPKELSLFKPRWWDIKIKLIIQGHEAASKLLAQFIRARGEK